jgi:hypothetical protein
MSWLNAEAKLNNWNKDVTEAVFHPPIFWLKAEAELNAERNDWYKDLTEAVFHPPIFWLKENAEWNINSMLLTLATFHFEMSASNVRLTKNISYMLPTAATFHSPIGPYAVAAVVGLVPQAVTAILMVVSVRAANWPMAGGASAASTSSARSVVVNGIGNGRKEEDFDTICDRFGRALSDDALVDRAALKAGETVLVLGAAGGVGTAAIQIAKAMGAKVIAAASTDEKCALCTTLGADATINYSTQNLREALKTLTEGKGPDVVYDPVGGDLAEPAFRSIAWRGRYLVVGFAGGPIPALPLNLTLLKGASLGGAPLPPKRFDAMLARAAGTRPPNPGHRGRALASETCCSKPMRPGHYR